jgi:STIP1 homology and U-box containing protein 1
MVLSCHIISKLLPYHGKQALTLLKSVDSTYEMAEDIWQVLAKAKYLDWEKHSTERLWRMESLKYVRY